MKLTLYFVTLPVPLTVIAVPPTGRYVNVGDSATFTCNASGVPTPNIIWYRDGKQINSSHYEISSITASSSQLTINNVSHADHGYYVCRASINPMEQAETTYFLAIIKLLLEDTALIINSEWNNDSRAQPTCNLYS